MRKVLLTMAAVVALATAGFAQKGNNQVGIAVEAGIPLGDDADIIKTGFGGSLKGLYGIGSAGQITLSAGYLSFSEKEETGMDMKTSIIPVFAGYRHNFGGFYVEPQVGVGIYGLKANFMGNKVSESESAFTYAAAVGYTISGFDISGRYQAGTKDGESGSLIGIRLGYNFTLGGGAARK